MNSVALAALLATAASNAEPPADPICRRLQHMVNAANESPRFASLAAEPGTGCRSKPLAATGG